MLDALSKNARKLILNAQHEAETPGATHVAPEHLLLGLLREPESTGARVLQDAVAARLTEAELAVEAPFARVRRLMLEAAPAGTGTTTEPKLTPAAKRVLDFAADEAHRFKHRYIGTEHLLIALTREKDGLAARGLQTFDLDLNTTRVLVANATGAQVDNRDEAATPPDTHPEVPQPNARLQSLKAKALALALRATTDELEAEIEQLLREAE